ncbi:MAG: aldehyde dehydrogenase family protein, partial [Bacteroidetes bacterium]|nr:aldehyde dehydrogenase family protein [Bacteroidota bacterium]
HSIQQARSLLRKARAAWTTYHTFDQEKVDAIVRAMVRAGIEASERLAVMAVEETGFGRVESKIKKNLFATQTLAERMRGMKTCGIIDTTDDGRVWEVANPMGIVAALVPSTNPTSTAMYKAIIAAKARCGIVLSPHPRARECTLEALRVVATAAYRAGAPEGLFACMTEISVEGTHALMGDPETDVILATGGSAMVKAAYSKGKPAFGVGSGNVPVYVDRTADVKKAAADILYGVSFDWGTLCSTERSIVADQPALARLKEALRAEGAYFLDATEADMLRRYAVPEGRLNIEQVGKAPAEIARAAGFQVPDKTRALVAEVFEVGKQEPLSMETLSPILSLYVEDGWQAGCERCKAILDFGGIGHTLGIHAGSDRIVREFALQKPAMRIVVNSVCALGSVGYTTALFPAMTLGPGTIGGSITGDNISPLHLINIKRVAFETNPIHAPQHSRKEPASLPRERARLPESIAPKEQHTPAAAWMDAVDARLRERTSGKRASAAAARPAREPGPSEKPADPSAGTTLPPEEIDALAARYRKD